MGRINKKSCVGDLSDIVNFLSLMYKEKVISF